MLKKSRKNNPKAGVEAALEAPAAHAPFARAVVERDFSYGDEDDEAAAEMDSAEETARYIADMIASLAFIAREAKFDLLGYLLDMARVEAEMQARQGETPLDND